MQTKTDFILFLRETMKGKLSVMENCWKGINSAATLDTAHQFTIGAERTQACVAMLHEMIEYLEKQN